MFTPQEIVLAWIVTFLAALLQGTVGVGFGILSVPVLTLLNPGFTPVPQILLALPMTVSAAWREREHLDIRGIWWIAAGRIPGAFVGAWVLTIIAERVLGIVIGGVVLSAVVAIGLGLSVRLNPLTRLAAGVASGFTGSASGIGGPPIALLYRNHGGGAIRSSLGAIFTIGVIINIVALAMTGAIEQPDLETASLLLIPMLAGFGISGRLTHHMEGERITMAILVVSGVAGSALLIRSLIG